MAHLIRTWNVFHGNAVPVRRHSHLAAAVRLAVEDAPAVVCLQELPVWSLPRLAAWSGYRSFPAVARGGVRPSGVSGWLTRRWQGVMRSAIAGQANAILVRPDLGALPAGTVQVSEGRRERRIVHAVRVEDVGLVATTHLTQRDHDAATAELRRVVGFLDGRAAAGEALVIAGDLNLVRPVLEGWSAPAEPPAIDHVLVRGRAAGLPFAWPVARRMHNGLVLSDHPPVELILA